MKIHSVTLHNIASFADVTVDFDAEPLASAEVFLITGRVGAGKSTILDAISLALFGVTPRLQATRAAQAYGSFEKAGVTTPRQILRSGCSEGRAELLFEAGGVEYKAVWSVDRKMAKGVNELVDLSNNHTFTGGEALDEVEKILGMTFDQFCRTTLLAQGDFARFLKSDDNGKSLILQRLIGEEIYERVGKAINERRRAADAEYKTAKALYDQVKPMTGDEEREQKDALKEVREKLKTLKGRADKIAAEVSWVRQFGILGEALAKAAKEDADARADCASDETASLRAVIREYAQTSGVRSDVRQAKRLTDEVAGCDTALGRCAAGALSLARNVDALEDKIKAGEEEVRILDGEQARGRERKPLYDVAGTVRTLADNLQAAVENARSCRADSVAGQKKLAEKLAPEAENTAARALDAGEKLAKVDKDVEDVTAELEAAGLPGLRKGLESMKLRLVNLHEVARYIEDVARLSQEREGLLEQRENEKALLGKLDGALPALQELCRQSLANLERARHNRDVAFEGVSDRIESLRAMLREGDVCPVCGATVGAVLPVSEAVRKVVAELDGTVSEMQECHDANGRELSKAQSDRENAARNIERLDADIKRKQTACDKLQESLGTLWQSMIGSGTPDNAVLAEEVGKINDEIDGQSKLISDAEAIEKRLKALRREQTAARTQFTEADALRQKAADALAAARTELERRTALADAADTAVANTLAQLSQKVAEAGDKLPEGVPEILAYADALCTEKADFEAREANLAERRKAIEAQRLTLADAQAALAELKTAVKDVPAPEDETKPARVGDAELAAEIRSLTVRARTLINDCENRKGQLRAAQTSIEAFFADNPGFSMERLAELDAFKADELESVLARLRQKDERAATAAGALSQCHSQLDEHRRLCPPDLCDFADEDLPKLAQLEKQQTEVADETTEYQSAEARISQLLESNKEVKAKRKLLREDRDKKDAVLANWKVLDNMFGSTDGKRFRTIALSYILGALIDRANQYMQNLTDRYRLSVYPGTFIILVEDAYQGYTVRPATSISGGESFIVSLALALALSDISEVSGADILFIDEGFGSLSGQELDNAIAMLQNLHSLSRRRVGIISHLPRVSESLPVQIRVTRATPLSPSPLTITSTPDAEA